ncbi:hypothetical protein BDY24DRAFT_442844 [Mrakia frigida]|uniref:uncharacterized protein n=1 Tax=Mrakia frigida TaxID=29902 RepID=UPI003FCC0B6C
MSAQTIPELALSDTSESSSSYHEVQYDPSKNGLWVDDQEEEVEEDEDEDEDEVVPPSTVTPWNASGWDDTAFVQVWEAAKEEYMKHHDPVSPYVPFKADRDLVDLSKQRTKDSWKIKLQAKEQLDREEAEANGLPLMGSKATSSLWYSSLFRPPPPTARKKRPAKKPKHTHQPTSLEAYHPLSPSFAPLSPSNDNVASTSSSTSQIPDLSLNPEPEPNWDATWTGEGEEQWEYEEEEEEAVYTGVRTVQLDFGGGGGGGGGRAGHWDDGELVKGWERGKREWEAIHGKSKSWLDQAMEDAAALAAAAQSSAQPATSASTSILPSSSSLPPKPSTTPVPVLDKVSRRNLARFGRAEGGSGTAGAGGEGGEEKEVVGQEGEGLSYD